jgi:hypothetical protein
LVRYTVVPFISSSLLLLHQLQFQQRLSSISVKLGWLQHPRKDNEMSKGRSDIERYSNCLMTEITEKQQTNLVEEIISLKQYMRQKPRSPWHEKMCYCNRLMFPKQKNERKQTKFFCDCKTNILMCIFGLFLIVSPVVAYDQYGNKATLTIFDYISWSFRAEIATFGNHPMNGDDDNQDDGRSPYHAVLMVPSATSSQDMQLCQVPPSLSVQELSNTPSDPASTNSPFHNQGGDVSSSMTESPSSPNPFQTVPTASTSSSLPWRFQGPIALLVSLGGCDPFTKARVVLDLHQRISSDLKFVVFYNNDPNDPDNIASLSALSSNDSPSSSIFDTTTVATNPPLTTEQKQVMDEKLVCFCLFIVY